MLLLLLSFCLKTRATECVDETFKEEYVNLYLCQNYSNYSETRTLLFKARAKILNDYIGEKIKLGELQNKKLEIQLYDPLLTYTQLAISRGKNAYFVTYSGFASLQELKTFVDYFASKNWKPFFTNSYQEEDYEISSSQIDNFFLKNKTSPITYAPLTVWSLDNLRLDYINDTLKYYVDLIQLDIKAISSLPTKIKDRFLLFQADAIFVLQGQEITVRFKAEESTGEDYDIYTYNKWVNICKGGKDNWIYTYSYDANQFYKRKTQKN